MVPKKSNKRKFGVQNNLENDVYLCRSTYAKICKNTENINRFIDFYKILYFFQYHHIIISITGRYSKSETLGI